MDDVPKIKYSYRKINIYIENNIKPNYMYGERILKRENDYISYAVKKNPRL